LTVGLFIYLAVAAAAVVLAPPHLVEASRRPEAQGGGELTPAEWVEAIAVARQLVLLAAGGVLAVFTLALTQRRDAVARARHEIDRDANRTTRYTEAVKQLGDDKTAVQFGGIYALGRIAQDSERDRRTIVQVLQAYIAEMAPRPYPQGPPPRPGLLQRLTGRRAVVDADHNRDPRILKESPAKAAVEVVGQLSTGLVADGIRIDLRRTRLQGAQLEGVDMSGAMFMDADLGFVDLCDATLDQALFSRSDMRHARLLRVHAHRALFIHATAHKADFTDADLQDTFFDRGVFNLCVFERANLSRASLRYARLDGTSFDGANLQGADLRNVVTSGASFVGADLRGALYDGDVHALGDTTGAKVGELPRRRVLLARVVERLKR
jgi:uncharacterized protein YjbI with pentapeptide repeats